MIWWKVETHACSAYFQPGGISFLSEVPPNSSNLRKSTWICEHSFICLSSLFWYEITGDLIKTVWWCHRLHVSCSSLKPIISVCCIEKCQCAYLTSWMIFFIKLDCFGEAYCHCLGGSIKFWHHIGMYFCSCSNLFSSCLSWTTYS